MSDGLTFKVLGDERLLRKLDRIAKKDARAVTRKGSRAGAKITTARAKALAPVGGTRTIGGTFFKKKKKGGSLRRAIRTRSAKRSRRYIGAVTVMGKGFFKGDTFYGAFVEFGHKVGKRGRANRKEVAGLHFMERAAKQTGRKSLKVAIDIIARGIEAAGRRNV
jgi:HK97 gp10 family phage protein